VAGARRGPRLRGLALSGAELAELPSGGVADDGELAIVHDLGHRLAGATASAIASRTILPRALTRAAGTSRTNLLSVSA